MVAWQCCRVCRAGRHGRLSSWRACHAPSGSEVGLMLGPGGRLLLLLASLLGDARGQWLPWSAWSDCPGRVGVVKQRGISLAEVTCSSVDIRLAVGQDFQERIRFLPSYPCCSQLLSLFPGIACASGRSLAQGLKLENWKRKPKNALVRQFEDHLWILRTVRD